MWRDERLQWEPIEYNNLTELIVEARRLWRPEFAVINGYVMHKNCKCQNSVYFV